MTKRNGLSQTVQCCCEATDKHLSFAESVVMIASETEATLGMSYADRLADEIMARIERDGCAHRSSIASVIEMVDATRASCQPARSTPQYVQPWQPMPDYLIGMALAPITYEPGAHMDTQLACMELTEIATSEGRPARMTLRGVTIHVYPNVSWESAVRLYLHKRNSKDNAPS